MKNFIIKKYKKGQTMDQISDELRLSKDYIYNVVNEHFSDDRARIMWATYAIALLATIMLIGSIQAGKRTLTHTDATARTAIERADAAEKEYIRLKKEVAELKEEIKGYRANMAVWNGLWEQLFPEYNRNK